MHSRNQYLRLLLALCLILSFFFFYIGGQAPVDKDKTLQDISPENYLQMSDEERLEALRLQGLKVPPVFNGTSILPKVTKEFVQSYKDCGHAFAPYGLVAYSELADEVTRVLDGQEGKP